MGLVGNALSFVVLRCDDDVKHATSWLLRALAVVDAFYLITCLLISSPASSSNLSGPSTITPTGCRKLSATSTHAWSRTSGRWRRSPTPSLCGRWFLIAHTITVWTVVLDHPHHHRVDSGP